MSHSSRLALYGFTRSCELGVDIECLKPVPELASIARHFFSPAESAQILSLSSPVDRQQAFYRCWTRKEAYVKALGGGLSIPLNSFDVSLLPGHPPRLLRCVETSGSAADWTLHHLDLIPGYIAAVAYRYPSLNIDLRYLNTQDLLSSAM